MLNGRQRQDHTPAGYRKARVNSPGLTTNGGDSRQLGKTLRQEVGVGPMTRVSRLFASVLVVAAESVATTGIASAHASASTAPAS